MKIINQTPTQMTLKDGNVSAMIMGVVLAIAGAVMFFQIHPAPSQTLIVEAVSGVLVLAGLLTVLLTTTITVTLDQSQITYRKKSLVSNKVTQYNTTDVTGVEVRNRIGYRQERTGANGPMRQVPVLYTQTVLVFKNGGVLALDHEHSSTMSSVALGGISVGGMPLGTGSSKENSIATQVAQFLHVPEQNIQPPTLGNLVETIGKIVN